MCNFWMKNTVIRSPSFALPSSSLTCTCRVRACTLCIRVYVVYLRVHRSPAPSFAFQASPFTLVHSHLHPRHSPLFTIIRNPRSPSPHPNSPSSTYHARSTLVHRCCRSCPTTLGCAAAPSSYMSRLQVLTLADPRWRSFVLAGSHLCLYHVHT